MMDQEQRKCVTDYVHLESKRTSRSVPTLEMFAVGHDVSDFFTIRFARNELLGKNETFSVNTDSKSVFNCQTSIENCQETTFSRLISAQVVLQVSRAKKSFSDPGLPMLSRPITQTQLCHAWQQLVATNKCNITSNTCADRKHREQELPFSKKIQVYNHYWQLYKNGVQLYLMTIALPCRGYPKSSRYIHKCTRQIKWRSTT